MRRRKRSARRTPSFVPSGGRLYAATSPQPMVAAQPAPPRTAVLQPAPSTELPAPEDRVISWARREAEWIRDNGW